MVSFFLLTVAGIAFGYRRASKKRRRLSWELIWIYGGIGLYVGFMFSCTLAIFTPYIWIECDSQTLRSMGSTQNCADAFVWASESNGETTAYRMLIANDNGSVSPLTIQAKPSNTQIFEMEGLDQAHIKTFILRHDPACWFKHLALTQINYIVEDYRYELTVPKGSVCNTFSAD